MAKTKIHVKSIDDFPGDAFQYTIPYTKTEENPDREMFTALKVLHAIGFVLAVNPLKLVRPSSLALAFCNIPYLLLLVFSGLWIFFNVFTATKELEFWTSMNKAQGPNDGNSTGAAGNSTSNDGNSTITAYITGPTFPLSTTFIVVSMGQTIACASVAVVLVLLSHLQYWSLPHLDEFQFSRHLPSRPFTFTVLLVYAISVAVCIYQGVYIGNLFGEHLLAKLLKGLFRTYVKVAAMTVAAISALEYGSIVKELQSVLSLVKIAPTVGAFTEVVTGVGQKLSLIESIQGLSQMTAIMASFVSSLLGGYILFFLLSVDACPNRTMMLISEVLPVAASMTPFLLLNLSAEYVKGRSSDVKRNLLKNFSSTASERHRLETILQDDPFPPALQLSTWSFMNLGNDNITNYFLQLITFFIIIIQFQNSE